MEVIGHEAPSPDFDIGGPARAAEEIGNERMIIGTEDVCRRPLPRWVTWSATWGTTILAGRAMRGPWQLVEPGSIKCTVTVIVDQEYQAQLELPEQASTEATPEKIPSRIRT